MQETAKPKGLAKIWREIKRPFGQCKHMFEYMHGYWQLHRFVERKRSWVSVDNIQKAKILVNCANTLIKYYPATWEIPSMLSIEEKRLLHLFAKHYFTGDGDIFDGGIFFGGCTEAFSGGLAENPNSRKIDKHIWAYELAMVTAPVYADFINSHCSEPVSVGEDFSSVIKKNIEHIKGTEKVKLFIGDIMEQEYPEKIEIMFLDVCKSQELNFAMQKLYSKMIPRKSLLIHQDYIFFGSPWIRVTMGYLADYFEYIGATPVNSAVWLLKKEIPQEVLNIDPCASFSAEKIIYLSNYWNHVFNDKQRTNIVCPVYESPRKLNKDFNEVLSELPL